MIQQRGKAYDEMDNNWSHMQAKYFMQHKVFYCAKFKL